MEWKILKESEGVEIQKVLNQWRHQFHLHIHGVTTDANGKLVVILTREKKGEERCQTNQK
ncbi:MAG: hypothetical protein GY714_20135 [Desulfobacterales bacterium]|nr:hypothetical protein [Desulfobacterales bacterium]